MRKRCRFRLSKTGIVSDMVQYEDEELLWKLDGEDYAVHAIMSAKRITSAKLHGDLKGKLQDGAVVDAVGQCKRIHEHDADLVCEYLGVTREQLFRTRGEARARAKELPCGTGWKEYESRGLTGGCTKLG